MSCFSLSEGICLFLDGAGWGGGVDIEFTSSLETTLLVFAGTAVKVSPVGGANRAHTDRFSSQNSHLFSFPWEKGSVENFHTTGFTQSSLSMRFVPSSCSSKALEHLLYNMLSFKYQSHLVAHDSRVASGAVLTGLLIRGQHRLKKKKKEFNEFQ